MHPLNQAFDERLEDIEAYLDLLASLEKQVQEGPPRMGTGGPAITVKQQKILYSGVYLHLYNLVEATVTQCLNAVSAAAVENGRWRPGDLCVQLRREWVRFTARTHVDLTYENRLRHAVDLCEELVQVLPVSALKIDRGGGGNWDDDGICAISNRLGFSLRISSAVYSGVKRPFRDEKGPLALIKSLRNSLAHGTLSFAECGEGVTVSELKDLKERTVLYLREVVDCFRSYIDTYEFLVPERRPVSAQA